LDEEDVVDKGTEDEISLDDEDELDEKRE